MLWSYWSQCSQSRVSLCPDRRLGVAEDLAEVVARHPEGIAVAITELGAANLSVGHTLVVHMGNLEGETKAVIFNHALNCTLLHLL